MPTNPFSRPRWTSRKFILAVSAQITALIILVWPGHESDIVEAATSVTSLFVILASSLGYVVSEAAIDASKVAATTDQEAKP
jgi:hypothetical protein